MLVNAPEPHAMSCRPCQGYDALLTGQLTTKNGNLHPPQGRHRHGNTAFAKEMATISFPRGTMVGLFYIELFCS